PGGDDRRRGRRGASAPGHERVDRPPKLVEATRLPVRGDAEHGRDGEPQREREGGHTLPRGANVTRLTTAQARTLPFMARRTRQALQPCRRCQAPGLWTSRPRWLLLERSSKPSEEAGMS